MGLAGRFVAHVRDSGLVEDGDRVVVACSGGLDSTVLLHLLRFSPGLPRLDLAVAHFDHRMRPDSHEDASWIRGLARAWGVPARIGVAARPPRGEAAARRARYRFLAAARARRRARWLLTAHHADDQAETVLFRVLRGTGLPGLGGIPERGPGGLLRPLLPFRRALLVAYAERWRVPHRTDPTNLDLRIARNVIRHEILPLAEASVLPGARKALLRLARLAGQDEEAWRSLLAPLLDGLRMEERGEGIVMARPAFLAHHPGVRARLIREAARLLGVALEEAGTRAALEFTSSGASGRRVSLPGGLILAREFDRLVLAPPTGGGGGGYLDIPEPGEGRGDLTLAGRSYRAEWTRSGRPAGSWVEAFASDRLTFPLRLRGWAPGDRIRMAYGSKKLKKVFAEARVPASERGRRPVLADGNGAVLWVPGLARAEAMARPRAGALLTIAVTEAEPA